MKKNINLKMIEKFLVKDGQIRYRGKDGATVFHIAMIRGIDYTSVISSLSYLLIRK